VLDWTCIAAFLVILEVGPWSNATRFFGLVGILLQCPLLAQSRHELVRRTRLLLTQADISRPFQNSAANCYNVLVSLGGTTMKRREFITLIGTATAWPLAARAQQPPLLVVGYLGSETPERFATRLTAFRRGLSETGFDEGRNVTIEYRWAEGQIDQLPTLAADLVHRNVSVIATPGSGVAALAAKAATTTIPIVFETGLDPIAAGIVRSLNRPGANVTGITSLNVAVAPKGLELLHELVPKAKSLAVFVNPTNPVNTGTNLKSLEASARARGLQLHVLTVSNERDFDAAFAKLFQLQAEGLVVAPDIIFNSRAEQLAVLTAKHAVPAVHTVREFAVSGGLMSYGGDIKETHRQAGIYTGRILKGEKPANLPVQQVTKVELVINLKTTKILGLTAPNTLIGRADEVIE
jgi:putative ABC transport system substrate-binding protein